VHAKGIAFGLHLMHGIPKIAVDQKLPILNSTYTADQIVSSTHCPTFIPDHWTINASHPGAQLYYDSVVLKWAADEIDFIYLDGIVGVSSLALHPSLSISLSISLSPSPPLSISPPPP
jgi:hypothetical protein